MSTEPEPIVDDHLPTTSVGLTGYNTDYVGKLASEFGVNREKITNLLIDYVRCFSIAVEQHARDYIKHNLTD